MHDSFQHSLIPRHVGFMNLNLSQLETAFVVVWVYMLLSARGFACAEFLRPHVAFLPD